MMAEGFGPDEKVDAVAIALGQGHLRRQGRSRPGDGAGSDNGCFLSPLRPANPMFPIVPDATMMSAQITAVGTSFEARNPVALSATRITRAGP